MELNDIKDLAKKYLGIDAYYEQFYALEEDVTFFTLYMKRHTQSNFQFDVRIKQNGSHKAFEMLYARYGQNKRHLESTFAEFIVLKLLINDIQQNNLHQNTSFFSDIEKHEIISYFEQSDDFKIDDILSDFIGCSRCYAEVATKICLLKHLNNK